MPTPPLPPPEASMALRHLRMAVRRCTRSQHPVLHGQPFTPARLRGLNLLLGDGLQRAQKGHHLAVLQVVAGLDSQPGLALGREKVVPPLVVVNRADTGVPAVAEEAVEDGDGVEPGRNEATDVGDKGYRGVGVAWEWRARGCSRARGCGMPRQAWGVLEGEPDVDDGGNGLNGGCVLAAFEEEVKTGSVLGVPVEEIKLCLLEGLARLYKCRELRVHESRNIGERWPAFESGQKGMLRS